MTARRADDDTRRYRHGQMDHDQMDHAGHQMPDDPTGHQGHGGHGMFGMHGLMMVACCIPMLVIAIVLVATGVVGFGFIVYAMGCTAMMFLMMRGMNHSGPRSGR